MKPEISNIVDSQGNQSDARGIPWVEQFSRHEAAELMFQVYLQEKSDLISEDTHPAQPLETVSSILQPVSTETGLGKILNMRRKHGDDNSEFPPTVPPGA